MSVENATMHFAYFRRKRGERETRASRVRGQECEKITTCTHTIGETVPAFKYERAYPIGRFTPRDPRKFFKDVTRSHIYSLISRTVI